MNEDVKTKIHQMIDTITNESLLQMVAEDIEYYAGNSDVVDELNPKQLSELDDAIAEVDNNKTTAWNDFKKEMNEWKKRCGIQAVQDQYAKSI